MLCMDDTHNEDDVLMIFDEMAVQNSLCREDDFASKFLFPLKHMKRPASLNKRVGILRMASRVRKVFGTFEKRAPARK